MTKMHAHPYPEWVVARLRMTEAGAAVDDRPIRPRAMGRATIAPGHAERPQRHVLAVRVAQGILIALTAWLIIVAATTRYG